MSTPKLPPLPDIGQQINRLVSAAFRKGQLWERCQGKGWPEAESDEFTKLRDETIPEVIAQLQRALASAPPAPQAKQCEWTNCPTRVGDKCCNEHASVAQQKPVAWKHDCAVLLTNDVELWVDACPHCGKPRTHPVQQAKPQPLSDEQVDRLFEAAVKARKFVTRQDFELGIRAAEAAHGIKE